MDCEGGPHLPMQPQQLYQTKKKPGLIIQSTVMKMTKTTKNNKKNPHNVERKRP
jgi:hypothetical protein